MFSTSAVSLEFTALEIRTIPLLRDATGINEYQAFQEITILINSKVNKDYKDRGQVVDASVTELAQLQLKYLSLSSLGRCRRIDNEGLF